MRDRAVLKTQQDINRWSIVFIGFFCLAFAFSGRASLGLIMPYWRDEFGWSSGFISNVGAAALVVMAITAPIAGRLVDIKGPRFTLMLGMGFLGIGCLLVASMTSKIMYIIGFAGFSALGFGIVASHVVATAITRSFDNNAGIATGVGTSGATGGQFLIVPLLASILAFVSWRWSFGVIGVSSLLFVFLVGVCLRHENRDNQSLPPEHAHNLAGDFRTVCSAPVFYILFLSFAICGFTTTGVIEVHLMPFANFCGFPPIPSATAYGLLSLVNMLGMIGAGWLTDRMNRPLLLGSIYLIRALTFLILVNLPGGSIEMLFVFAVMFGIVDYSTIPVTASLVASHIGLRTMGLAMGLISAGHAIGGATGVFLGGYLFDMLGNFTAVWLSSFCLAIAAGLMVFTIRNHAPDSLTATQ